MKRHLPRLFEHVLEGRLDPKAVITHRFPLEEIADGRTRNLAIAGAAIGALAATAFLMQQSRE